MSKCSRAVSILSPFRISCGLPPSHVDVSYSLSTQDVQEHKLAIDCVRKIPCGMQLPSSRAYLGGEDLQNTCLVHVHWEVHDIWQKERQLLTDDVCQ